MPVDARTKEHKKVRKRSGEHKPVPSEDGKRLTISDYLLLKLGRVTSSGLFIPEIDGLRFFAIAAVIAYHVSMRMPHTYDIGTHFSLMHNISSIVSFAADAGAFGVQLFFVISGFILSLPFASHYLTGRKMPSLRKYYIRRVTRLEPPYIISLILCIPLLLVIGHETVSYMLKHFAASLVYCHQLVYGVKSPLNEVLWSLECEVQFYVLAPVFAKVYRIHSVAVRRVIIALVPCIVYAAAQGIAEASGTVGIASVGRIVDNLLILRNLGFFFAGFLLSDVFLTQWQTKPQKRWYWDIIAAAAIVVLILILQHRPFVIPKLLRILFLLPSLVFIIYIGAFRGMIWNRIVRNRWLVTTGGMCYTIYLYHDFIIRAGLRVTREYCSSIPVQIAFFLIVCSAICAVPFVLCEKPFMYSDWPQKLKQRILMFKLR